MPLKALAWLLLMVAVGLPSAVAEVVTATAASREVVLSGFTRPRARLPLVAEVAGRVEAVAAEVGEAIAADGLFARLDDTFIALELEANRVEQARLRSRIDFHRTEAERQRALAAQGDTSRAALDAAEQALQDDRLALVALEVEERLLEERVARTRVMAPPGWRVTERRVEPGQWVNVGDPLGEAVDLSLLVVPYALTPAQYLRLEERRDALTVELPDLDLTRAARVYRIDPDFDPETRKLPLELAVELPPGQARGGWRALLTLELAVGGGTVRVPRQALHGSYEEHWLVREDGTRVPVTVLSDLAADTDTVKVSAPGLAPGDRFRARPPD